MADQKHSRTENFEPRIETREIVIGAAAVHEKIKRSCPRTTQAEHIKAKYLLIKKLRRRFIMKLLDRGVGQNAALAALLPAAPVQCHKDLEEFRKAVPVCALDLHAAFAAHPRTIIAEFLQLPRRYHFAELFR
jgi:hypothetical protein